MELIGRTRELERLDQAWRRASSGEPQMVLLTGRRRVGKTALVAEFARSHRSVLMTATREAMGVQLARFAERLRTAGATVPVPSTFGSWHEALEFAAAAATDEPLLVGIDEVPYLADADLAFGSVVQAAWDAIIHRGRPPKLMLLLTGSSRRVMDLLTAGGGPLFGRLDTHLRLEPFALEETGAFLPALDPTGRLLSYAITGGYPRHLLAWDDHATLAANVDRLVRPGEMLFDDAGLIVHEEFPSGVGFERVLLAIGRGRHAFGEIKTEAELRVEGPLTALENVGLIRAETPLGGPRRAAPHYVIIDPYLRFWFGPLSRIRQGVELGASGADVLTTGVWDTHVGSIFEDEARRHAVRAATAGQLPSCVVGRWWRTGRDPIEIDVVGRRDDDVVLVGEAKWSNSLDHRKAAERLRAQADRAFGTSPERTIAIWSRARPRRAVDAITFGVQDLVT